MFSSRTFTQEPKVCSQLVKMHQTMFIYHMAVIFLKQLDILLKINDETSVGIFQKKRSFNFSFWGFNQISTAAFPADDEGSLARRDASFVLLFFFGKFLT